MPSVVIHAETGSSAELRHEVPLFVRDPFLYVEHDGTRHVVAGVLDLPFLEHLVGIELHPLEVFGRDQFMAQGLSRYDAALEACVRAVKEFGVRSAIVPERFPLDFGDRLRENGIAVRVDREHFAERRRVKTDHEVAGVRRAQRAAEAGMDAARALLREAQDALRSVSSSDVKTAIITAFAEHGSTSDEPIVSHGPQSAIGHHRGSGRIEHGEPILIDLAPRDLETGCFADMTRTYVLGEPPDELIELHSLVQEALHRALADIRPGAIASEIFDGTCDIFERSGYATLRTKQQEQALQDGFIHSLGHGVGLAVHEDPVLGPSCGKTLLAGEVLAIEPGLYKSGCGGLRHEDLVLVTNKGCEKLTEYPYELAP